MGFVRSASGWIALVSYLAMGAMLYLTVLPSAGGLWPPDFRLLGYDVASITPFVEGLNSDGLDTYAMILRSWDRVFILSLALWLILTGWRGSAIRYVVAGLAIVYAMVDLAENVMIWRFVCLMVLDPALVSAASHLTMAKFASFYLCALVLIVHLRRER